VKKWLSGIFQEPRRKKSTLKTVQDKFTDFLEILDNNNRVLKIIGDMEEKSQGEYLFDINYIRSSLSEIRTGVRDIIDGMISLGGEPYAALKASYEKIDAEIDRILPESRPVEKDEFTIPFEELGHERAWSVGSKNAQLGEMKSQLQLPAPEGFAISAWAYRHFVDANQLRSRIDLLLRNGNSNRREYLLNLGLLAVEAGAEGPFSKKSNASYLVNYRWSITALNSRIGSGFDEKVIPRYWDFCYKIHLPTKKAGNFSLWGLGGQGWASNENHKFDDNYYQITRSRMASRL